MINLRKIILALSIVLLATSCSKKEENVIEDQVIEVKKEKAVEKEVNVMPLSFISKVILENIENNDNTRYVNEAIANYSQVEEGNFDIAIVPGLLGTYFYEKNDKNIEIAAITSTDNIKIISDSPINGQKDLKGKNLLIPDPVENLSKVVEKKLGPLNIFLRLNISYYKRMADIVDKLDNMTNFISFLSDPYYEKIIDKNYYAADLSGLLPIGKGEFVSEIIIVKKDYLKDNKESFDKFLEDYNISSQKIKEDPKISQDLLEEYKIDENQAKEAIKRINPVFIEADTMKGTYQVFLDKLNQVDQSLLGEEKPGEDFYYDKN